MDSDIVIVNAVIFTADKNNTKASAMAIKGETILYVGDDASAEKFITDETDIMDFHGGTILPGMIDAHNHIMIVAAVMMYEINLLGCANLDEIRDRIKEYLKNNPELPPYSGFGYPTILFCLDGPHKSVLDELCPGIKTCLP